MNARLGLLFSALLPLAASCDTVCGSVVVEGGDGGGGAACKAVTCSGHGVCESRDGGAVCACDQGYYAQGLECLPSAGGDGGAGPDAGGDAGGGPDAGADAGRDGGLDSGVDAGGTPDAGAPPPPPTWLVALPEDNGQIYLGWRLEGQPVGYDVYRSVASGSGYTKINTALVDKSTNYLDGPLTIGTRYFYVVRAIGSGGSQSGYSNEASVLAQSTGSRVALTIDNIQPNTYNMSMRVGDVDGDRMLDFMFRVQQGRDLCPDAAVQVKMYRSNGTPRWSLDTKVFDSEGYICADTCASDPWCARCQASGRSCSPDSPPKCCQGTEGSVTNGINWVPWTLWDLDGDGKAEVFGLVRESGRDVTSVRNGEDGAVKGPFLERASADTQEYIVAYLDGVHPSLVVLSREYPPSIVTAYDSNFGVKWQFTSMTDASHTLRVADLDGDGNDEILDGALAIDHDGKEKWHNSHSHTDGVFAGDVNTDAQHPGLEVMIWGETTPGVYMFRGIDGWSDGTLYWNVPGIHGGGWAADIRQDYPGMEVFALEPYVTNNLYSSSGALITSAGLGFPIDWDGDAYKEVTFNGAICNGQTLQALQGGASGNFVYALDVIGDYREELLVMRESAGNAYFLIYTNTTVNTRRAPSPWETRPYGQIKQRTCLHESLGIQ